MRYPLGGVLLRAIVPAVLLAVVIAGVATWATDGSARVGLAMGLACGVVMLANALGAMVATLAGAREAFQLLLIATGASLVRMVASASLAGAAQLLLNPPAMGLWGGVVVGFVAFSVAEVLVLRPLVVHAGGPGQRGESFDAPGGAPPAAQRIGSNA